MDGKDFLAHFLVCFFEGLLESSSVSLLKVSHWKEIQKAGVLAEEIFPRYLLLDFFHFRSLDWKTEEGVI